VMLDRYWYGDASRISPEAPVPVLLFREEEYRLGGAANVAANCAKLGARTLLLSVVGRDEAGERLEKLLKKEGVDAKLQRDRRVHTTQKLRVIGRRQQLLRIDIEATPSSEVLASKLTDFKSALHECDVVLLSDYGKGGLAHIATMIKRARAAGKPVLVDPKGDDWTKYRGATLITPNRGEFREVVRLPHFLHGQHVRSDRGDDRQNTFAFRLRLGLIRFAVSLDRVPVLHVIVRDDELVG